MSLLTAERLFVGHEQPDSALLVADGIAYRCYVYLSRNDWSIEAVCVRVQENGAEVEVFHNLVARASAQEVTDTNGIPLDSPKILASGTVFVVHWLQADDIGDTPVAKNWQIYRATMDMEAFSTTSWNHRGAVALLETHALYDHCLVEGHATDFIVARCTDTDEVAIVRYNGYDWIDIEWTTTTAIGINPAVLGVCASDDDDDVVIAYERTSTGRLVVQRLDAEDGGNLAAPVAVFPTFEPTADHAEEANHWVQVSLVRTATDRVAIMGEAQPGINVEDQTAPGVEWIHAVAARLVNSASAALVGNEFWCPNMSMGSRLFTYASGSSTSTPTLELYVMLTWRSVLTAAEWSQSYAYVCNLDYALWDEMATGAFLQPRPIVTITGNSIGIPDARTSGWMPEDTDPHPGGPTRRMNHLSTPSGAPPFGPDVKTRTIAWPFFTTIGTTSDLGDTDFDGDADDLVTNTTVERAGIRGLVVYLEDPWTVFRDATDPTQPVDNFAGTYPRAMHQCVPWGRSTFVAGGTPQLYDGRQMVECGFFWNPEILNAGESTGGFLTALGTYQYYAVYSWTDRNGLVHGSAPSQVLSFTLTGVNNAIRLAIRTHNMSVKDSYGHWLIVNPINIEVFRTTAGGSVFYRLFGATDPGSAVDMRPRDTPVNDRDTLSGYVFVDDELSDDELALQGQGPYQYDADGLFTEPLPQVIPAMHTASLYQNRIAAADSLDPSRIVYSDTNDPVIGANYLAPVFGTNMWHRTGEILETTGLVETGEQLIQFTRNGIFSLVGQDVGFGALSFTSRRLHDGLGCVDPKSVVLYPLGIGFQSAKGYYTLAPSGEAIYGVLARSRDQPQSVSGAAIEDDLREAGNVRAASHDPGRSRISLVCNGRPDVQQVWTGTVSNAPAAGVWSISGFPLPVLHLSLGGLGNDNADVADQLEDAIDALVAADAPSTFQFIVESATAIGSTIVITLLPGVELTLTGDGPATGAISFVMTEQLTTRPWVLDYYYDFQQWTRAELLQGNANSRLCELADGCYWQGDGVSRHVVLAQGYVAIQRDPNDADAYADFNSGAGVPISLTFSWLHVAGVAGGQALHEIAVITERFNDEEVFATLEYDFDGRYEGQTVQPTSYAWPRTGETETPADLRVRPAVRKCRAHRLRIYERSDVTTDRTMSIVGLVATIGTLGKTTRVADAHRGET